MIKNGTYFAPTKWEECQREDLNMIPKMIANGFTPEFSHKDRKAERLIPENCPCDAVTFFKGDLHVWNCIHKKGNIEYEWMTANLVDGYYTNHKPVKSLEILLKKLKQNQI